MTKPFRSHVLALSAWTLKKAHIVSCQEAWTQITKFLHARQIPHQPSFPSKTIPDCIRYIIGVFAITSNHRRTFLLHIIILACVKAKI